MYQTSFFLAKIYSPMSIMPFIWHVHVNVLSGLKYFPQLQKPTHARTPYALDIQVFSHVEGPCIRSIFWKFSYTSSPCIRSAQERVSPEMHSRSADYMYFWWRTFSTTFQWSHTHTHTHYIFCSSTSHNYPLFFPTFQRRIWGVPVVP